MSDQRLIDIAKHRPALQPPRLHHRQHPLHEPAPLGTVRPPADSPPDHRMAKRAFGAIVRRLDTLVAHEGPHALLDLEDLEARRRRLDAAATLAPSQCRLDLAPQPRRDRLEPLPIDGPIAEAMPILIPVKLPGPVETTTLSICLRETSFCRSIRSRVGSRTSAMA